jgi:hypothetical protein
MTGDAAQADPQRMTKQTVIFAWVTASLVPIGILIVVALNPQASFARGIQVILDRGRERPTMWLKFIALMIVFAALGAGLSRLVNRRKLKSARGFEVKVTSLRQ